MAGPIRIRLQLTGIKKLVRDTEQSALLAPAMHHAMEEVGAIGLATARQRAPVGPSGNGHVGGLTSAKFQMKMQARPLPLWVRVETTAARKWAGHGNYAYTKRVEWDPKFHHAGWLRSAFAQLAGRFESALQAAAHEIESGWGA